MSLNRYHRKSLERALNNQLRRLNNKKSKVGRWSERISLWRLIVFIGGLTAIYMAARVGNPWLTGLVTAASVGGFGTLVSWHRRLDKILEKFSGWSEIRTAHLARMQLNWEGIPEYPPEHENREHPFGRDLNITGPHSLMHLIDISIYRGGSENLKNWLLATEPDIERTKRNQLLVEELKPLAHFRDRLMLRAKLTRARQSEKDWDMDTLQRWLKQNREKSYRKSLALLWGLSGINILLALLYVFGILNPWFILSFLIYLLVYNYNSGKIKGIFDESYQIDKLLRRFSAILLYLENFPYKEHSELKAFCSLYHNNDSSPSRYLRKIALIASAASLQKNDLLWIVLNTLVPWDLSFAELLNRYKRELDEKLSRWLDRFYELEALCSLANFAWLNPGYTFPEIVEPGESQSFEAADLGHPLIPHLERVTNDISISEIGSILLITGSNMSGKSTFLRTLGVNLVLAFAGGPVVASRLQTVPFRIYSSINVVDSLDAGLSHFYAEVKRLRGMLDALRQPHAYPLFYLVDEIFRGTNNRERLIGSTSFLKKVAGSRGIGIISTHDLELTELEQDIPKLTNWHFEETIKEGKMHFEYRLKPGPCPTTNALRIMEMEGLPVEDS